MSMDRQQPIALANGVYWVGAADNQMPLNDQQMSAVDVFAVVAAQATCDDIFGKRIWFFYSAMPR